MKVFSSGKELNEKIVNAVSKLSGPVASTLGPRGRNVIVKTKSGRPIVTKDGVTISRFIEFDDPIENAIAQILKQASEETVNNAGDGTSTSCVLTQSIFTECQKYLAAGVSPVELKRGIDKVAIKLIDSLKELSKPVTKLEEIESVATISANGDKVIGKIIAEAVDLTGKDGSILVKEGHSIKTTLEVVDGFRFKGGILSPNFITNEKLAHLRYEKPLFLVTDERISTVDQMLPALNLAIRDKRPLVIIADDVVEEALASLIVNVERGTIKVAALKVAAYGNEKDNTLEDIALAVGASFISIRKDKTLSEIKLQDLGEAKTVESNKNNTTIMGGNGNSQDISNKIEALKAEFKITEDIHECERIQERITRLSSGVAVIHVGGLTEVEMIETKHRIEDALEAVKSAQEEGILDGGGIALLKSFAQLKQEDIQFDNEEQRIGWKVLEKSVEAPIRQMLINAGESPDIVVNNIKTLNKGYNIALREYDDLLEKGIIDPCKVTRVALQNAVSVSTTLITTWHSIVEV